jgi:hypothetical protein
VNYVYFLNVFISVNIIFMVIIFYILDYFSFEIMLFKIQDRLVHEATELDE